MSPVRAPLALSAALALALAGAGCAGARSRASAPPPRDRVTLAVPGHGALEVAVPPGWTASEDAGEPPAPRALRLTGPGGAFVALLSPFWNPSEPERPQARADNAQLFAELARRGALAGAVERELPLQELVGDGVHGYWFAATDRALEGKDPGPGEWRHLLQGAAAVGPLVVAFTLLDNAPGSQRQQVLEVVRGARHVAAPNAGATPRGSGDESGDADAGEGDGEGDGDTAGDEEADGAAVPLRVEVRGRPWTVLVDLPGFRIYRPRAQGAGVGTVVVGHDPERGIVASVVLRDAGGARDAAACRDADLAKIRAARPGLADLRLSGSGDGARALYVVAELGGKPIPQLHGHAWLQREDVCANVHLSKAGPGPDDAAALGAILSSVRYGEDL